MFPFTHHLSFRLATSLATNTFQRIPNPHPHAPQHRFIAHHGPLREILRPRFLSQPSAPSPVVILGFRSSSSPASLLPTNLRSILSPLPPLQHHQHHPPAYFGLATYASPLTPRQSGRHPLELLSLDRAPNHDLSILSRSRRQRVGVWRQPVRRAD